MFKILLVFLIVIGGFTLANQYAPQLLGMQLFHFGQYTLTGGILLVILLGYTGFKCISA